MGMAIQALQAPEMPTVRAASSLLVDLLRAAPTDETLMGLVRDQGRNIVHVLVVALVAASRSLLPQYSDVLQQLNKTSTEALHVWLNECLAASVFPAPHVSDTDRAAFVQKVLRCRTKGMKQVVEDFALICRQLQGWV
eukprot:Colp12_sorted_trinity150504_noHs@1028